MISKTFDNITPLLNYPITFVAPNWAPGFQCQSGECGLCCIVQLPTGISQMFNPKINRAICRLYDLKRKQCKKYSTRPIGCKTYPFSFGVEGSQLKLSISLECPGTNSKKEIQPELLSNIFDQENCNRVLQMKKLYDQAFLNPNIWRNSHELWNLLKLKMKEYFKELDHFPFINDFVNMIWQESAGFYKKKLEKIPIVSVFDFIKSTEGVYISTRFKTRKLGLVDTKGSKVIILLLDENLQINKKVKTRIPKKFSKLTLNTEAQQMLLDYVSLNSIRPFLSLAARRTFLNHEPVPFNLIKTLCGSLLGIDSGATLISIRDRLKIINRETMRELIGFNEGNLHSFFTNPSSVHTR